MAITDLTGTKWRLNDYIPMDALANFGGHKTSLGSKYDVAYTSDYVSEFGSNYDSLRSSGNSAWTTPTGYVLNYFVGNVSGPGPYFVGEGNPSGNWTDEGAKTIEITGGEDATNTNLIAWLEANATQIVDPPQDWLYKFLNDSGLMRVFQKLKTLLDKKADTSAVPFVANYGQTTYADVTAAIDADRSIVVNFPANRNLICVTYSTYVQSQNVLMYGIFKYQTWVSLATITLTPANEWRVTHTKLQELLESGTNIKTVNNQSLLGSGNIDVGGGTVDQSYDPTSTNAQSGTAVTEAISTRASMRDSSQANARVTVGTDSAWISFRNGGGAGVNVLGNVNENMVFQKTLTSSEYVDGATGDLSTLTTDNKTNLVSAINEVYEKSGEPFRVKNWANSDLNVSIPYCTEEVANTSIAKMTYSIDAEEGASYQIVGMIAYEVFDSNNQRINCWPVCQFTGNGQKELSVRWACMGSSRKTAKKINAWVLLKHR